MNRRTTPQENKIRDYLNQRTNGFGENDKSSRKAVRSRKTRIARSYRRVINTAIEGNCGDWEQVDLTIKSSRKTQWQKQPDECLLKSFAHKWSGSSRTVYLPFGKTSLQKEARTRLSRKNTRHYWY